MISMNLEERVRKQIGAEGPQLEASAYEDRIDIRLRDMCPAELLHYISGAMEDMEVDAKEKAENDAWHERMGEDM